MIPIYEKIVVISVKKLFKNTTIKIPSNLFKTDIFDTRINLKFSYFFPINFLFTKKDSHFWLP